MTNRRLLLTLLFSVTCPAVEAQLPVGGEFRINSYTTASQAKPAVAADAHGNLVVVWRSAYQDGSSGGVFGQRFNAAGLPQGSEFHVNTVTYYDQSHPAVASDPHGNFVVVWDSHYDPGYSFGVLGQRFDASGVPQGSEFQVDSYTGGSNPAVASDANGNFVVVWVSGFQDGNGAGVFGQRFNASGVPQGSEFEANSYTTGHQNYTKIASDAGGNFVVVWQSLGQDGSGRGIFGQRFNASGVPQGGEFRVNSYTTSSQNPGVASAVNGHFVVVWEGCCQCCQYGNWDIWGQRYDSDLIFKDGFQ